MDGDVLPPGDHVARYCGGSRMNPETDLPTVEGFHERSGETGLSVNWLEFFDAEHMAHAVDQIREAFKQKDYGVGPSGRFVVLNVSQAVMAANAIDGCALEAIHRPEPNDPSHAQLEGVPKDERALGVATELLHLVSAADVFPAVV